MNENDEKPVSMSLAPIEIENHQKYRPNGRPRTRNPIGKPGNPTANWQRRCRILAKQLIRNGTASKVLDDDRHPHWFSMVKLLVEQGHGKAVETINKVGDNRIEIVVRQE